MVNGEQMYNRGKTTHKEHLKEPEGKTGSIKKTQRGRKHKVKNVWNNRKIACSVRENSRGLG